MQALTTLGSCTHASTGTDALGVPRRQAIRHAKSRQSYWHMAKTIASGVGLTNQWLQEQGMLSLKSIWAKLAPLRRTA
ncbi:MAG: hypothetical protein R3C56_41375 [Pirellulaceae bacterium]